MRLIAPVPGLTDDRLTWVVLLAADNDGRDGPAAMVESAHADRREALDALEDASPRVHGGIPIPPRTAPAASLAVGRLALS